MNKQGNIRATKSIVGFIGLGRMGMPMSKNLLKAGFHLIVHNRSRDKVEEMARLGAQPAPSPEEVTQSCDILLTCLPDVATVEEVFMGKGGVLSAAKPGQVLVDHSTVGPSTSRRIGEAARAKRASFLDAPISGGVERAADASLTIMVGGDAEAFQRARPVFEALGNNVRHVGPPGSGSAVKLVNQLLVGIHSLAAAEALLLGVRTGADPELLLDILEKSWGYSFMLSRNGPITVNREFDNAMAPIRLFLKDMGLIEELARELGAPIPSGKQALKIFQEAARQGMAEIDIAAIVTLLEKQVDTR